MSLISTKFLSSLVQSHINVNRILSDSVKVVQVRNYAARKGTRDRKTKKKVKNELVKVGFIPHNQRDKDKMLLNRKQLKFDDSWKKDPVDDVYVAKYYKWVVYSFADAVQCHQETHSPEMYNQPNANLHVTVELNMQAEKKTRFVDNFTKIVQVPHKFDHGSERNIVVFSKDTEEQRAALAAGASLAGGVELIKQVQNGQLNLADFQYHIAHPNILPELVALRGLLKRRFPNPKAGTLDVNVLQAVDKFMNGINYSATKDEYEKDYGVINTVIGTLDMDSNHLEENFKALINDINTMKPKRPGTFITRCLLSSPPSPEVLKVDHNLYLEQEAPKQENKKLVEEDDEVVGERIAL
ncbi:39S ribosomal protein L1, mitochondrial [Aethina tumida]|uniref:39S ribosomal protein L1, mitochondrial n=1 Tax=Aethina tumida TaxID=116153 RepID=UPI0021477D84|nr:39S ribosomal protein L1, mitochondrial [Aethina tumida]